jgi:hypothetical protein
LLTVFLFAFLFLRVTPQIVSGFKSTVSKQFSPASDSGTPVATLVVDEQGTPVAVTPAPSAATNTPVPPPPTATPVPQCVQVANSALILRDEANTARTGTRIPIGTVLQLLEPGTPAVKDNKGHTWRHVQTLSSDGAQPKSGFVLDDDKYLTPAQCP